jgi:MoaA/NifB/PqqE/SkfB family radical SAM enzyme
MSLRNRLREILKMVASGGPAVCNIAVTNLCNATCDFCNYARNKKLAGRGVMVDVNDLQNAIDILYHKGVRYLTFSGGEPFLHPHLYDMVAYSVQKGIRPSICTNGYRLDADTIKTISEIGLKTIIISIDAGSVGEHEKNRGLPGICARIRKANHHLARLSIRSMASVTINRLITDYPGLILFLRDLGFETVTFSYPKRTLGSSSLVFSKTSSLVDYSAEELIVAFRKILDLKSCFSILNPAESMKDMIRYLRGKNQIFPCFGGYKYFFLDWNLDVWRCDYWPSKMCSIQEFENEPLIRDSCTLCTSDCYRDSSVLLHFAVAIGDALACLKRGEISKAARTLVTKSTALSIKSLLNEWKTVRKLATREFHVQQKI